VPDEIKWRALQDTSSACTTNTGAYGRGESSAREERRQRPTTAGRYGPRWPDGGIHTSIPSMTMYMDIDIDIDMSLDVAVNVNMDFYRDTDVGVDEYRHGHGQTWTWTWTWTCIWAWTRIWTWAGAYIY
jgi:hypothetical protein